MFAARLLLVLSAFLLLLAACRKTEITSYRIPKEKDPELPLATKASGDTNAPRAAPGMAGTPVATASGSSLVWSAPPSWKPKPASAMRKGSFTVPGDGGGDADMSITAFPGDVGGEVANVNRWRGQLQLLPIAAAGLATAVTRLQQNGLAIGVVDLVATGANPQRTLGAMIPFDGATWFFKLAGPDALVAREKPAFMDFLKTVKASPGAP